MIAFVISTSLLDRRGLVTEEYTKSLAQSNQLVSAQPYIPVNTTIDGATYPRVCIFATTACLCISLCLPCIYMYISLEYANPVVRLIVAVYISSR